MLQSIDIQTLRFQPAFGGYDGKTMTSMTLTRLFPLFRGAVVILLAWPQAAAPAANQERLEVRWADLKQHVAGRNLEVVLPDATHVQGNVVDVSAAALEIEIRKTSNAQNYPKGRALIPRSSLKTLQFKQVRGRWRALGTAIGAAAGGAAGGLASIPVSNEGNTERAAAITAGAVGAGAAVGFLAGREADKRITIITIVGD